MQCMKNSSVVSVLRALVVACVVLAGSSCRRHDYQVRIFYIPALKNEQCARVITEALGQQTRLPNMEDSINGDSIKFDFEKRTLTVEYDSMKTEKKNLEHAIALAGFAVNEIPADTNAVAKLPPECR